MSLSMETVQLALKIWSGKVFLVIEVFQDIQFICFLLLEFLGFGVTYETKYLKLWSCLKKYLVSMFTSVSTFFFLN